MSQAIANGILLALGEIVAGIIVLLIILKVLGLLTEAIEDICTEFGDWARRISEDMKAPTTKHTGPWCEQGFRWKFRP